jgi:hypothetical protein
MELIKLIKCFKDAQATRFFCLEKQTPIWQVTGKGNFVTVLVIPRIIAMAAIGVPYCHGSQFCLFMEQTQLQLISLSMK